MSPIHINHLFFLLLVSLSMIFIYHFYGTWLDAAQEQLDIYLFSESSYQPKQEHFIMYRCDAAIDMHNCGGHADRLKGIMSLYLWSLLSNRTLLVRITRPCNFARLLEPNEVDWNREVMFRLDEIAHIYRHGDSDFKYRLSWLNFTQLKQKKRLLIVTTNRNFFESVGRNPSYESSLRDLGFEPARLDLPYTFATLYRRLFKLTARLQQKYDSFVSRAKPNPNTKLICAQVNILAVRIGGQFYERTLWKDVKFQSVENAKNYWNIIKEKLIPDASLNSTSYRIFLSTDNQEIHDSFVREFGQETLIYNEGAFNHIDMIRYSKNDSDCESSEKTVLDFHALQLCDSAVITNTQFGSFGMWLRPDPLKDVYMYDTNEEKFFKIEFMEQYTAV